ncbi:MAG TPA: type IV pilus twitching motility protein PilT [Chondromyces sp.]|nr:type IV pilus twitching motility protein PilT [Chondromyces sp.]
MAELQRVDRFLKLMNDRGASDLHFSVGRPPMLRVSGRMEQVRYRTVKETDLADLLKPIAPVARWQEFLDSGDTDFSYELADVGRFRVNLFRQRRGAGAVFRIIPTKIMTLEQLGLPPQLRKLANVRRGMVIVTGPTGSGKSTTLAAIIDLLNEQHTYHILTIEDPIEFVHPNKKCLIHQREVGTHAASFAEALRAAGREDPDVILVGELRDLDTISMALSAAERGTIVFATLHTNNAIKTVDRIISVFPAGEQEGARNVLAESLHAVVAQQLLPKIGGGRAAAVEIVFANAAISNLIRRGKIGQITSIVQGGAKQGMVDMDTAIRELYEQGLVSARAAYDKAIDKELFKDIVDEAATGDGGV